MQFIKSDIKYIYYDSQIDEQALSPKPELDFILENFDLKYHQVITILLEKQIPFNNDGYFSISDTIGNIIAESILGFPESKLIVDPLDDISKTVFENNGYKITNLEDLLKIIT